MDKITVDFYNDELSALIAVIDDYVRAYNYARADRFPDSHWESLRTAVAKFEEAKQYEVKDGQ